jgi:cysteine synthase A
MVRLNRMRPSGAGEVLAKLEAWNPGRSVKDRIALSMIQAAERDGLLRPGGTIVEATSGNTGIGLALVGADRGYRVILTMPDSMSAERAVLLRGLGADLMLTSASDGMAGALYLAEELVAEHGYFMPNQFTNPANPEIHRRTTGPEILDAIEEDGGGIDAFVAGVGTGGTITGVGEVLKARYPDVLIIAVEPARSAVLSGGKPGMHAIQGIGAGFVPEILNRSIIDRVIVAEDEDAVAAHKELARLEGISAGISSGANVFAAMEIARELGPQSRVVTILPDSGERYLSVR